jgi:hypothetical protein
MKAIHTGNLILVALDSFAMDINKVVEFPIKLYLKSDLTEEVSNACGITIETLSLNGVEKHYRILATNIKDFKPNIYVSSEWDTENSIGVCFYKDPKDNTVKKFNGSLMFIGRDITDLVNDLLSLY